MPRSGKGLNLRISHKLFLLVAGTALLSTVAIAGVTVWNLSRGFDAYLAERDAQRLETLAQALEEQLQDMEGASRSPTWAQFEAGLAAAFLDAGIAPPAAPPSRPLETGRSTAPRPRATDGTGPRPPLGLAQRLVLLDGADNRIIGPPLPDRSGPKVERRSVVINGRTIATLALLPLGPGRSESDALFLENQYRLVAIVLVAVLLVSALLAWFAARAATNPIAAVTRLTHRFAQGDFSARLPTKGRDEIAMMCQDINAMAEKLQETDQARRDWLASIGHELRTPLSVLQGEIEALQDGITKPDQAALSSLREECERLGRLIEDLRALALYDVVGPRLIVEECDPVDLIVRAVQRHREAARQARIEVTVDMAALTAGAAQWDRIRIEQVLDNVIANAIAYTDPPGVIVITAAGDETVVLTLADSAPGVSPENMERLFEPLFRAEQSRDRRFGGSGLGLSVSHSIITAHGGTITAQPSALGGVAIIITIPRSIAA